MTNTPQTHTFVSRPIQTKKNGVICKFVSLTQHYSSQWIKRDGSRDSTQLGPKSPALLVEPLLEHQTMDKVHKTDDLKMCYTINRIYRIVQIWPVWKSWQKVTSFLLTECYIAPLHAATCEEYIKCWQSSNTCLFYTHFGISPTMSQNQTKLSSITQFFLPYSDGWIFPHCLKIC